jgi:hypothetical protein
LKVISKINFFQLLQLYRAKTVRLMFPKVEQGASADTPEGKIQMLAKELKSLHSKINEMKNEHNASGMYFATFNV